MAWQLQRIPWIAPVEVPVRLPEELLATLEAAGRRLEGAGEGVAAAVVAFEAVRLMDVIEGTMEGDDVDTDEDTNEDTEDDGGG